MQAEHQHSVPWQHAPEQPYPAMPPQPPAPQPGMVWLPPVANDHSGLTITGGIIILLTLFTGFGTAHSYIASALPTLVKLGMLLLALLFPVFMFAFGVRIFIQARRWEGINQRRQAAAAWGSASGVSLAQPQPFPNIEALPPSFKIKLKANWFASLALFCLMVATLFCLQASPNLSSRFLFQGPIVHWIAYWSILLLSPIGGIAGYLVWQSFPQFIEVTAQGLIVRHPLLDQFNRARGSARKQMIPWNDIRLFAIREGKPGTAKVCYELSSPLKVVTFARIVRPRWWSLYRPAQPFGEYNAQMDALLAFISARTGLLLYDVR